MSMTNNMFVIHRGDRPERLVHVMKQFSEQKLNAHIYDAIIDYPGWRGCALSHLDLIERHKDDLFIGIFEDDIKFMGDVTTELNMCLKELPVDWDILYLGCNPRKPQKQYSPHLFKIDGAVCNHAVLYHPREGGLVEYLLAHKDEVKKIDRYFMEVLQPKFNCYCVYPFLATQDSKFQSDTCKRADYDQIIINYFKYIVAYADKK